MPSRQVFSRCSSRPPRFRKRAVSWTFPPVPERSGHVVMLRMLRAVTSRRSSIARCRSSSRRTRGARWRSCADQRRRARSLPVPAGSSTTPGTLRPRSSASSGYGTEAAARSSVQAAIAAASARSSSTTTSCPTRSAVRRRSPTSSSVVARTTATRRTCSSEPNAGTVGPMAWPRVKRTVLFPGVSHPFRNGRSGRPRSTFPRETG